jgi:ATP-dependent Lhr-like helicase
MKVFVRANISKSPTIPSWFSEMLPLSFDAALQIGKFRGLVKERLRNRKECIRFIQDFVHCSEKAAVTIYEYCREQEEFSELSDDKTIVMEKFKEEKEFIVFHSMYGRRVNDALAKAFAFAAGRLRQRDVELGVNDSCFFIAGETLDENKILGVVGSKNLRKILEEAIENSDALKRRFRHCATRSLMILRQYKGREKSVGKQQVHSEFLISAVRKASKEFPILREARREVLEDVMDIVHAEEVLKWIETGRVKIKKIRVPIVSPFAMQIMMQGRSDLIKMEDRVSFLKRMHGLHLKVIEGKHDKG